MTHPINVTRSSMPPFEEFCEEIRPLWESRWLTNMGVKHKQLEESLEAFLQTDHVVLYTNGHLALEHVLRAMDLPKGGEVITTPFTFVSTTHAIVNNGLKPVFCDINCRDYTIDADQIESLITEKTVAIVPVHVYGNMCDVEKIGEIARRHGLKVIYDAAHAFGVRYRGISSGSFGDASMFSFHATKVFNTIEGGAVCTADSALEEKLNSLKNFGLQGAESCVDVGGNAKMSEFQAAMGICNLRHFEEEVALRSLAAQHYRKRLSGVDGITLCKVQPEVEPNYAYFPVLFDGFRLSRDKVFERLREEGITARKYFYPLTSDFACYRERNTAPAQETPVAYHIAQCVLTLPLYAGLSIDDVDRICDVILEIQEGSL